MNVPQSQLAKTLQRYEARKKDRNRNIRLINEGQYFDIDDPERVKKFLENRDFSKIDVKEIMTSEKSFPELVESKPAVEYGKSLERIIGTNDLVDISFLTKAVSISRATGRIWLTSSSGKIIGYGTGFLISPTLIMTNHHVLPDFNTVLLAKIEMDYQFDVNQVLMPTQLYQLDPSNFYFSDEDLDYAIIAVLPYSNNNKPISEYGFNKLIKDQGKTIISQWLNIIEHPNGMPKQAGIRENQLVDILDNFLQYRTDTAPGASGSPVYNEKWEVVGLHHSGVYEKDAEGNILSTAGGIWNSSMGEDKIKWTMNEGVRISSILKHMDNRNLNQTQLAIYTQIFTTEQKSQTNNFINNKENKTPMKEATLASDGSVTWNIPLSVTVSLGRPSNANINPGNATQSFKISDDGIIENPKSEDEVVRLAKEEFLKRGNVINVRMGFVFENGWVTKKRALVLTVAKRKPIGQLKKEGTDVLPKMFLNYPVEISGPTIKDLVAYKKGTETLEVLISSANILLEESRYVPPPDGELKKLTAVMKVNANVSPEKGWENLKPYLENTKNTLTVGMYDFGATHIKESIEKAAISNSFENMTMAIQVGSDVGGNGTKKDDLEDKVMVEELGNTLGDKFKNAWVKIGKVNGWVPSSYHIKVAVRDSNAVSVSSGNWQSSNQPDLEKLENPTQSFLLKNYNREWHVILENETIAKAYEKYILNDYDYNKNTILGSREENLMDQIYFLLPTLELSSQFEDNIEYKIFEPFIREREFTVTPLLSPDNFYQEVLTLVESAQKELYIQNQTFNAPGENQEKLDKLINAVLQKQSEGVDVKIIFRNFIPAVARENIEALVEMGFKESSIKVNPKCHTKGVIVDQEKVMIGSQNWSNDGVSVNRDASLLFEDEELANYFRSIFLHDWDKLAKSNIGSESANLEIISKDTLAPTGMSKIGWSEIQEML